MTGAGAATSAPMPAIAGSARHGRRSAKAEPSDDGFADGAPTGTTSISVILTKVRTQGYER